MKTEDMASFIDGLKEKLEKEQVAIIADDLNNLINDNTLMNNDLLKKDTTIEKLNSDKEKLMNANMNLLQMQPAEDDTKLLKPQEKEEIKSKPLSSYFDNKGNFKKELE